MIEICDVKNLEEVKRVVERNVWFARSVCK